MDTIKTLSSEPFRHFVSTIGALPTSFTESMSYYELLAWLCNYLQNTVIPAVNDNAEALAELQQVVKDLKEYVENYFDNLDVQTEINNKLDEMADSGELTDIIAQYLGLAGVLAFDTIANMAAAENLANGSICRVLGNSSYAAGDGAFYRVRALINTDVVDGVNLVAITAAPTLVAERITDYYTDQNTTNITTNTTDIANIKNNLANKEYGLVAISRNVTDLVNYVYYSPDGEKFYRVGEAIPDFEYDSSAIIEINGTYYYFGCAAHKSFYCYSSDLVHWSEPALTLDTPSYNWAAYPFYDPVNNKYYLYSSLQYQSGTVHNAVGNDTPYFKIIRQEFTVNDDKTLTCGVPEDVKYVANESYIDPAVCYDSIHGYTLAIKNEITCKIDLYNTNDLNNIGSAYATLDGAGSEGPQLIDNEGFITMYVHDYALNNMIVTGLDHDLGETYSSVLVALPTGMHNSANLRRHCCQMPEIFRHAGIMPCSKQTLDLITSIGVKNTPLFICSDYTVHGSVREMAGVWSGGATYNLPNLPYMLYLTGGGASVNQITLNLKPYYDYDISLMLGPTNVAIYGDSSVHTITTAATANDNRLATFPLLKNNLFSVPYAW